MRILLSSLRRADQLSKHERKFEATGNEFREELVIKCSIDIKGNCIVRGSVEDVDGTTHSLRVSPTLSLLPSCCMRRATEYGVATCDKECCCYVRQSMLLLRATENVGATCDNNFNNAATNVTSIQGNYDVDDAKLGLWIKSELESEAQVRG
jgi:hypothetical protein